MATADDRRTTPLDELRTAAGGTDSLPVDVERHGDSYVVSALLPNLRRQDFDVTVHGRQVRISAALPDHRRRLLPSRRRTVSRVVRLPKPVDHKTAEATYHDGLLRVTVETWKR